MICNSKDGLRTLAHSTALPGSNRQSSQQQEYGNDASFHVAPNVKLMPMMKEARLTPFLFVDNSVILLIWKWLGMVRYYDL
jgi:hypothetical protein